MSTSIPIENGKRIPQLLEVGTASSSSYFVVSVNDLTRKISLQNLRNTFNGDTATSNLNNLYYSCEKTNEYINTIYDEFSRVNTQMHNIDNRVELIMTTVGSNVSDIENRINNMYQELTDADQTIRLTLSQKVTELDSKINNTNTEVNNIKTLLGPITKISMGTSTPTSLAPGEMYLQYF